MILLDTSFLFALFQKTDSNHAAAVKLATAINNDHPVMPVEVFQELITVITNKVYSQAAIKVGEILLASDSPIGIIHSKPPRFQTVWLNFKELQLHTFSYVDCLLYTLAHELECTVCTFDKTLAQQLG